MLQIKKETANTYEYKVGNNVNFGIFCAFVKNPIALS